mgnify:CR=1 FL=1|jgi:hypothetical protein
MIQDNASDVRFESPEVASVFDQYPEEIRPRLLFLRDLIFETAAETDGVGALQETLKWGEPSYLTAETKSGSTVRIGWKEKKDHYAIYFKCTTDLIPTFRSKYPTTFKYEGTRAITFNLEDDIPAEELRDCISLALTYHQRKNRR